VKVGPFVQRQGRSSFDEEPCHRQTLTLYPCSPNPRLFPPWGYVFRRSGVQLFGMDAPERLNA
jgi:hypothetical protein